jgi:hypothetical protein
MAFMQKQVDRFSAWRVETTCGTECVPVDVCGDVENLGQYIEGTEQDAPELVEGWFCRLSAPGYMDCTEWSGPHQTRVQALAELDRMYGDDE